MLSLFFSWKIRGIKHDTGTGTRGRGTVFRDDNTFFLKKFADLTELFCNYMSKVNDPDFLL